MTKTRDTNIELLRIISMLIIITGHLTSYGIMKVDSTNCYVLWAAGSQVNRVFTSFLVSGGDVGVGVFFMITGYFLIGSEKSRSIRKIIESVAVYASISLVISGILMFSSKSLNLDILKSFAPLGSGMWWFISAYLLLVMIASSINRIVNSLSEKNTG